LENKEAIQIRKVRYNELFDLQKISINTFQETFSDSNSDEDLKLYYAENLTVEKLSTEFQNTNSEFYFATFQNEIIGYLKLNFGQAQTDLQDDKAVEIERIYVLKAFLGKGVGQMLFDFAIQIAKKRNAEYVWLGVWEENHRAISFYKKNGFGEFGKHSFMLGTDNQTDLMMKLSLENCMKFI